MEIKVVIAWIISLSSVAESFLATRTVDCGNVSNIGIDHATLRRQNNGTKYTSTAEIDCDEGYYIQDEHQLLGISTRIITCNDKGRWTKIPVCIPKDCGPLENVNMTDAYLRLLFTDTKYRSQAAITCNTGYYNVNMKIQPEGSSISLITCSMNGTWSNLPNCSKKDCGNVSYISIDHATIRRQNNGTKYTSTAEIDCDEGYYIQNEVQLLGISTRKIICNDKGRWTKIPVCIQKDCGNLAYLTLQNAKNKTSINGTKYTSVANVSCDIGFTVKGEHTESISTTQIKCNNSGLWSNLPTCIRKDCMVPTSLGNGTFDISNGTKFGASAFYRCIPGFTLHGDNSRTCLASGNWSEIVVHCTLNKCDKTPNITNITHGSSYVTESNASYQCDKGYILNGDKTLVCLLNGTWNTKPPICRLTDCGKLNKPNNGNVTFTNTTYKSAATFECNDGYFLTNNRTSVCTAFGNWSNTPTCKIKDCGNITNLSNGQVYQGNGTTYLSVSIYRCDVGYTLNGNNTTKCIENGTWDNAKVKCEINDCGQPDKPTHGNVITPIGTTYKSVSLYNCSVGYDLKGAATRECQANESWSLSVPTCEIKNCSKLNAPDNGKVSHDSGHVSYNDNATFTCNPGYRMHGSGFVTCTANGNWSSPIPTSMNVRNIQTIVACLPLAKIQTGLTNASVTKVLQTCRMGKVESVKRKLCLQSASVVMVCQVLSIVTKLNIVRSTRCVIQSRIKLIMEGCFVLGAWMNEYVTKKKREHPFQFVLNAAQAICVIIKAVAIQIFRLESKEVRCALIVSI